MDNHLPMIMETVDVKIANELLETGLYRQPEYSRSRDCYILIKKAVKK